jgi:HD superfamily phosphohydrolase
MKTVKTLDKDFVCPFPYKRIRVFPDRDLRATLIELSMIDTRIMQRLRNTKQLGNSNVAYPTAEHSRFSHSLGVLYWSSKILTALSDNYNSGANNPKLVELSNLVRNHLQEKLPKVDRKIFSNPTFLGVTWFEQLVRLYALLHDITHIPFGHTIEDQASLFERHDDDLPRLAFVFDMLKKEVEKSYHFENIDCSNDLMQIAIEYINLIELMFVVGCVTSEPATDDETRTKWLKKWEEVKEDIHKPLLLTYDIVSNTICADLMDYTMRDTLFASMPKTFDKALLTCMKVVPYDTIFYDGKKSGKNKKSMYRLGVNISRKKVRHDIITAILDLLRIRYDLTEKVYYHHTKVITDAMLEKILRTLKDEKELKFTPTEIYEQYLGDEGFFNLLETKLKSKKELANTLEILNKTFRRNLYKATFRINKNAPLSKKGKLSVIDCSTPDGRNRIEKEIIDELGEKYQTNLEEGDIIISFPPEKMQKKVAKALIEWSDGQVFTFENLPLEANYSNEVGILTERYQTLWSMTIYLNPSKVHYLRLVESICEDKFDIHNESILRNYLREKYHTMYESSEVITDISRKVISMESNFNASKAAKGGSHTDLNDKTEFVEDAFHNVVKNRIDSRKPKSSKKPKEGDSDNPKLDFNDNKQ